MVGEPAYTPLNSSIVSWTGDVSYIWDKFKKEDTFYIDTYTKGSDEWYYKHIEYKTYDKICPSIKDYLYQKPPQFSVCTLGQMHHLQEKVGLVGILIISYPYIEAAAAIISNLVFRFS